MERRLFEIDGYKIWAFSYEEAWRDYLKIKNF